MDTLRTGVALLAILLLQTAILAQETNDASVASRPEDQLIAEAIWSLVDFGSDDAINVRAAFRKAEDAYPNSARVSYWRGRFSAYESDRSQEFDRLSDFLKEFSDPNPDDLRISDPSVQRKLQNMRSYAKAISRRIEQRAKELSVDDATIAFELSLLDAASRDPGLIAAWSRLMECSDTVIALTAADAWASL